MAVAAAIRASLGGSTRYQERGGHMTLQTILTLIFYAWLFAALFVWWRNYILSKKRFELVDRVMADATMKAAEAARISSEATRSLIKLMEDRPDHVP